MHRTSVDIVFAWIDALNRRSSEDLAKLSSPDIEIVGPRGSGYGIDLLRDWLNNVGLRLESLRTFSRGRNVVVLQRGVWHSVETGEFVGDAEVASRFQVDDNRIIAFERFSDLETALNASGLRESDEVNRA